MQVCPYTLNVFDLATDKLLRRYMLRPEDINQVVAFAFETRASHNFFKSSIDLGTLPTFCNFHHVEHFYRQHRGRSGKRRLQRRLRLHVRRTRLRSDRVLVAAEYVLANNAQLLHARSSRGWLQYRGLEFPMGDRRYFWNESVADTSGRLSDAFLSSSQQPSRIRGVHEDSERPAVVSKQLSRVSGIFFDTFIDDFYVFKNCYHKIFTSCLVYLLMLHPW